MTIRCKFGKKLL